MSKIKKKEIGDFAIMKTEKGFGGDLLSKIWLPYLSIYLSMPIIEN